MLRVALLGVIAVALVAPPSVVAAPAGQPAQPLTEADVAARLAPSVVHIVTDQVQGSGVRIPDGIITNDHVVGDASDVEFIDANGTHAHGAVVKDDPGLDLALLQTDDNLPAVSLAPAVQQRQGDEVLVLGYPLGIGGQATLSRGLISALRRTEQGNLFIHTDAAVNPGNSGGAVVDMRGELMGIPSYGYGAHN